MANSISPYLVSNEIYNKDYGDSSGIVNQSISWSNYLTTNGGSNVSQANQGAGLWDSIAEAPSEAGSYIWSTAKGTWESVKSAGVAVLDAGGSVINSAGEKIGSGFNFLENKLFLYIGVLLLVVVIVAKTGIIKQVLPMGML